MKRLFGTDGMRGEAGVFPLDAHSVYVTGRSLARHLSENLGGRTPRIVIGRDTRESGAWLEAAIVSGARAGGAECRSAGVITTPGVAYLTGALPADAGVVISASHNPFGDNGIKIFSPTGRKLDEATERQIEADIFAEGESACVTTKLEGTEDSDSAPLQRRYLEYLRTRVAAGLNLAGLKMVIDSANGAASALAPELFKSLGAEVIAINASPDGRNINKNSGSLYLDQLAARVVTESAEFGVAYDGDADRALFVDRDGTIVDGDATLWVMAQSMAGRGELVNETVVATVMSNLGLEKAVRARGWTLLRTDVGDKYVLDRLVSTGASLGGEQSGHIIFPQISLAGDGMLTTILLLRAMAESNRPLHELISGFRKYPQILVNVRVKERVPFGEVPEIAEAVQRVEEKLGESGRLLLRYSGTEPLARVMIEGADQKEIEELADSLATVIRNALGQEIKS